MISDLPKTAGDFVAFMKSVWDCDMQSNDDGGVTLFASPLYDTYADAIVTAKMCGMVHTGWTKVDGLNWRVYRFPNASDGVRIANDGNAVSYTAHRFGKRWRKAA